MENKPFFTLQDKLIKAAKNKHILLRVNLEVTYQCNFRCRHCYIPDSYKQAYKSKELDTKGIFFILDELKKQGCFYIGFTGGEPFLRKDFLSILRYAKKNGFQFSIGSNGSLINQRLARELAKLAVHRVDITFPSFRKAAFDAITGTSNMYKRVVACVDFLKREKVGLGIRTCLLKENQDEVGKIESWAKRLKAMFRLDSILSPRINGDRTPYKYRGWIAKEDFLKDEFLSLAKKEKDNAKFQYRLKDILYCGAGVNQAALTPAGELKPCLLLDSPKYSITELGLKKAWDRMGDWVDRRRISSFYTCEICSLRGYCKICPARSWLYAKNYTSCDPDCRDFAAGLIRGMNR